ncbi:MAG: hypothetical protein Q7L55_02610 [Actinomycetota bacterium]|nr:hypothetical protein [Actinomycetota bacterium]
MSRNQASAPQVRVSKPPSIQDVLEGAAVRVVELATGRAVTFNDDGREDGLVDLLLLDDGPSVAIEVVLDADPKYEAAMKLLLKTDGGYPSTVELSNCWRSWQVTVSRHAVIRNVKMELNALLFQLESERVYLESVIEFPRLSSASPQSVARLREIGVVRLCSAPSSRGGSALLLLEGVEAAVGSHWETLLTHVETTLESPQWADVQHKLEQSGADERHVFLGLTMGSPGEAWFALDDGSADLPTRAPQLPNWVTHHWMLRLPYGRVIHWSPTMGWFDPYRPTVFR